MCKDDDATGMFGYCRGKGLLKLARLARDKLLEFDAECLGRRFSLLQFKLGRRFAWVIQRSEIRMAWMDLTQQFQAFAARSVDM